MRRNGRNLFLCCISALLALCAERSCPQSLNDTIKLKEFEVVASYPVSNIGFKRVHIDSSFLMPNLGADLSKILSNYSTVFIKSYGSGSLSTPSFRGTSANHTQVEWNGIILNSPMLGQMNLSQIPVSQFDGIDILYGAAGISSTSGAFGGVINLVTSPDWENRVNTTVSQTVASFNTYTTTVNVAAGTSVFQSVTKANLTSSKNNFPYYNDYIGKELKQVNSGFYQYGISEDLFYRLKDKHLFTGKIWYSKDYTDIPPITSAVDTAHLNPPADSIYAENLEDESLRTLLEYKFLEKKYNFSVRSALVDQNMRYRDTLLDVSHRYYSFTNRLRFNWLGTPKLLIKPGLDINYDRVNSESYAGIKTRYTTGIFGDLVYDPSKKVRLSLVIREDMIDGALMPFIFATGIRLNPFNKANISFSANFSRNYRYPTLNDLYWFPGGNPDLEPEQSLSAEAGVVGNYVSGNSKFFIESEITGYFSDITNYIKWEPVQGNALQFMPINIPEVYVRGLEVGLSAKYFVGKVKLSLNANYNFCKSTNEKVPDFLSHTVGKQLTYIPVNTMNTTLTAEYRKFFLSYNFFYTSLRYTSTANETYMPGYNLSNIFLGKNFGLKNFSLSLQLEINNLFDLDYQSIASRPMPGINYGITVRFNFKGKPGQ